MYRPFQTQRRISYAVAAVFFALIFPYGTIGDGEISTTYKVFCIVLNLLSAGLFGFMLYRTLTKRLPVDDFSAFGWCMAVLAFCHLVFTGINWGGWLCIGISALILAAMGVLYLKAQKDPRKETPPQEE